MSISEIAGGLTIPPIVELWTLDTTPIGGSHILRWCSDMDGDQVVMFDGVAYPPMGIKAEGFEMTGVGALPQPRLTVAALSGLMSALVHEFDGLRGARVTRVRTFAPFLDNGETPDPTQYFGREVYTINRRVGGDLRVEAAFELAAGIDQQGVALPRGQALRDFCRLIYRRYDPVSDTFINDEHDPCPYAGEACFDALDQPTTDRAQDQCSKRLSGCRARFGQHGNLPAHLFPGLRII